MLLFFEWVKVCNVVFVVGELNTVAKLSRCTLITRPVIQRCCSSESSPPQQAFDEQMLEFLVCPLSKQPLRWV